MKLNDIFKILKEEGISKEDLLYEEKPYNKKELELYRFYKTKDNKKERYLFLKTYFNKRTKTTFFEFGLFNWLGKKYDENLVEMIYENKNLQSVYIDRNLANELKKPKTPEEEVEFIRQVIRIYKGDLWG